MKRAGICQRKEDLIKELFFNKRIVKHNDTVKLFSKNGRESVSFIVNRGYVFWRIVYNRRIEVIPMSYLVWFAHFGDFDPNKQIDHIDRNHSNNSIHNLRHVFPFENAMNRGDNVPVETRNILRELMKSKKETPYSLQKKGYGDHKTMKSIRDGIYIIDRFLQDQKGVN